MRKKDKIVLFYSLLVRTDRKFTRLFNKPDYFRNPLMQGGTVIGYSK